MSVQSFPKFASAAKKATGIKPIYGASFDVIDKSNKVFLSDFENKPINNTRYVVFDIETTNLSPRVGELIEFGASIVENNQIIDNIQFFVKSSKPLSKFTIELTKITDKMLQTEGLEIEQALEKSMKS
ncbi:exonuclease domain-containing protein [Mycoplasmopsis cynos]|uniref:exonuclease domain-containing protein n=1 Tax=Mycoplasmopsis cynos TaxID=171284 RepID=UPI0021FD6260|nr:exonuclease domain-containing protein [Mycoplasmopsis cynos]UWV77011.1 exonuclease domain-containing protein [Mycoplasmopsis cynos]